MAKYQAYAEYKDSGVEWLGEIPSHWGIRKLVWFFSAEKGKNGQLLTKEYCGLNTGDYPVYSGQTENNGIMGSIDSYEFDVGNNGVLFSTTVGAKAMTLSFLQGKFSLSQNCMIIKPRKNNISTRFYYYHCQPLFAKERGLIPEHMQASFRVEDLYSYRISLPPINEQTQIANFLDHETAQIDTLIAKQEKLIELLKEKRQAVISHAVTKGLDPNVPMKDSGVEWLGEVPEHWEVTRFAYQIFYQEGPGILAVDFHETGIPLLRIQNVKSDFVSNDYKTYLLPSKVLSKWDHYRVEKGDLIISCSASTGLVSEVDESTVGAIPYTGLIRLKPRTRKIISQYIKLLVQSDLFFEQIEVLQTGSTIQHFGPFHLQQMYISLPPNEEQEVICLEVKNRVRDIENLILKAESAIQLMQERRTALISAAVTGKIDVRNWQAPNVAEADTELSA